MPATRDHDDNREPRKPGDPSLRAPQQGASGSEPGARSPAPRRSVVDRRAGLDRRSTADDRRDDATGLERRRGAGKRLPDFAKAAEEGELTHEQFLFVTAVEAFKKANGKTFPTWTDVLEVIRLLGYRKVQPSALNLPRSEDWCEKPDAPANVRTFARYENRDEAA